MPPSPDNGDPATPVNVGEEWLTGKGRRSHEFRDGDPFTELLKDHEYLVYLRNLIAEQMRKGNFKGGTYSYSLGGIQGIPKYLKDYSTVLTFGETGNLAVTYLGGYRVEVYITDVNFSNGLADVTFHVWNSSTLASAIRPPVVGYTKFYNQTIAPMINPPYGPLSEVTQSFWWTETISF